MSAVAVNEGKFWSKGEFNGFLGLFSNIVTNLMVMAGLQLGIGMPAELVIGRMLPAVGVGIALGNFYWAWFAKRVAKKTGNPNVCALPFGPSVGHMFVVTFVVTGPVFWGTGNPWLAWGVAMAWCALEGIVEILAAPFAKTLRAKIPRAAMLGNASGLALTLIAMAPISQVWSVPYIGIVAFGMAMLGFFGKKEMPFGIPVALWMIIIGIIIGWSTGFMSWDGLTESISNLSFSVPRPAFDHLIDGFRTLFNGCEYFEAAPILIAALPLGISNAIGTLNNVESAAAAGDEYPEREALFSDGIMTLVDVVLGGPMPTTVYIGHPAYKEMGARTSYSIMAGIGTLIVTWITLIPMLIALIPLEAILPILLFIAMTIGSQAFMASPKHHYPAIIVAMMFWLSNWVVTIIQNTVQSVRIVEDLLPGPPAAPYILQNLQPQLASNEIYYGALLSMSRGHVMTAAGMAMIVIFIIEKKLIGASITACVLAGLAFLGFIHAPQLSFNASPQETIAYLAMAAVIFIVHLYNQKFHPEDNSEVFGEGMKENTKEA